MSKLMTTESFADAERRLLETLEAKIESRCSDLGAGAASSDLAVRSLIDDRCRALGEEVETFKATTSALEAGMRALVADRCDAVRQEVERSVASGEQRLQDLCSALAEQLGRLKASCESALAAADVRLQEQGQATEAQLSEFRLLVSTGVGDQCAALATQFAELKVSLESKYVDARQLDSLRTEVEETRVSLDKANTGLLDDVKLLRLDVQARCESLSEAVKQVARNLQEAEVTMASQSKSSEAEHKQLGTELGGRCTALDSMIEDVRAFGATLQERCAALDGDVGCLLKARSASEQLASELRAFVEHRCHAVEEDVAALRESGTAADQQIRTCLTGQCCALEEEIRALHSVEPAVAQIAACEERWEARFETLEQDTRADVERRCRTLNEDRLSTLKALESAIAVVDKVKGKMESRCLDLEEQLRKLVETRCSSLDARIAAIASKEPASEVVKNAIATAEERLQVISFWATNITEHRLQSVDVTQKLTTVEERIRELEASLKKVDLAEQLQEASVAHESRCAAMDVRCQAIDTRVSALNVSELIAGYGGKLHDRINAIQIQMERRCSQVETQLVALHKESSVGSPK